MESALSYNNINKYIRLFLIYKIYTNIQQITNIRSLCELRTSRRQRSCNFASKEAIRILIDKQSLSTNTTTNQQNNIDIDLTTNTQGVLIDKQSLSTQGEKSQSETWSLMRSRMATINDFILNLDEIKREANEMRDPNVYGKMLIANINNIQGLIDYLEKN